MDILLNSLVIAGLFSFFLWGKRCRLEGLKRERVLSGHLLLTLGDNSLYLSLVLLYVLEDFAGDVGRQLLLDNGHCQCYRLTAAVRPFLGECGDNIGEGEQLAFEIQLFVTQGIGVTGAVILLVMAFNPVDDLPEPLRRMEFIQNLPGIVGMELYEVELTLGELAVLFNQSGINTDLADIMEQPCYQQFDTFFIGKPEVFAQLHGDMRDGV